MKHNENTREEFRKNVYLDESTIEIYKLICSEGNWSEWVRNQMKKSYEDETQLAEEEEKCHKKLEEIKTRREILRTIEIKYFNSFTKEQKRYFLEIPRLLTEGHEYEKIWERFKSYFKKDIELDKFSRAYKYFKEGKNEI